MRGMALVISMSMLVGACSTTSTIHVARGPAYEAEIASSDANTLRVYGDDRLIYEVPREEVTDIDHPGNVVFVVGAALVGLAALTAISILNDGNSRQSDRDAATVVGVIYGLPGVIMMAAGGATYLVSRSNARAFETARFPVPSHPPEGRFRPTFPPPPPPAAPPPPAPPAAPWAPAPPTGGAAVPPGDPGAAPADKPQIVPAPPAEPPR